MNSENVGLILFAIIALGAVIAFLLVIGGPTATGNISKYQKIGTSGFSERDAVDACHRGFSCNDGQGAVPTGRYDEVGNLYECVCQMYSYNSFYKTDDPITYWRSAYSKS